MGSHVSEPTPPVGHVEVGVAEPGVSVCVAAAPFSLRDVVVEVDVDVLGGCFCGYGVEDLWGRALERGKLQRM